MPSELHSRLQALNELLPRLIASLFDADYCQAVQCLFGLAPGTRGTTLTARRRQVAKLLKYHVDHFRSRVELDLLTAVAVAIHDDLLRYQSRVKRPVGSPEPRGDTHRLGPEHFTHEEELVSRIWQHVYGLRAELIVCGRLSEQQGSAAQAEDHRQAALREQVALRAIIREYVETYGEQHIRHGEAEYAVAGLERLAGWEA